MGGWGDAGDAGVLQAMSAFFYFYRGKWFIYFWARDCNAGWVEINTHTDLDSLFVQQEFKIRGRSILVPEPFSLKLKWLEVDTLLRFAFPPWCSASLLTIAQAICSGKKKVIDWFRVAEVLAEHGLHASLRVGNTVLAARRLPDEVQMRTDNHKGLIRIGVQKKEKELAARTARLVRAELNRLGMEIRAVVRRSKRGRLGEEHDMVIEVVATEDKGPIRKISGELKLRRLWSKEGLNTARLAIQKEAATECEWWQTEASTGKWAGRLLVFGSVVVIGG